MSEKKKDEKEPIDNLRFYKKHAQPPKEALKTIGGGRLKGKTDINPQWRVEALTEMFGPIGIGWHYQVARRTRFKSDNGEIALFIEVHLQYRWSDKDVVGQWSSIVVGTGGTMLVAKEKDGLRVNDEAEKMAITDALSVCMKYLGIASDIYRGRWDGSKYAASDLGGVRPGKAPPEPGAKDALLDSQPGLKETLVDSLIQKLDEAETFNALELVGKLIKAQNIEDRAVRDRLARAYKARADELNPVA